MTPGKVRQAAYRKRQRGTGLAQVNVRVPPELAAELYAAAAFAREHRDCTFVPVFRLPNGRLLFLR